MWQELGIETTIKAQEWAQYLEFLGPPPNKAVDAYRLGWIYDFPDAINGLELFTCDSGNNNTNWCNEEYDALVEEAKQTVDDEARYELYRQLEGIMFDEDGDVPLTPIMWYTYPEPRERRGSGHVLHQPADQIDFTKVVVQGGYQLAVDEMTGGALGAPPALLRQRCPSGRQSDEMAAFIIRRIVWTIPVILLVILMIFVMMRQIEGNPFRRPSGPCRRRSRPTSSGSSTSTSPWYMQYLLYVKGVFTFDLGPSLSCATDRTSRTSSRSTSRAR